MSSATPVAPPPRLAPVWLGRRPHFGIGWLQGALAALALVLCFQGKARTAYAVLLFIAVPVLRLTLSAEYRGRVRARLAGFWHELERYPAEPAIPWRATLAFVVAPAAALLLLRGPAIMSGDSQPVMLQATSLVRHGSWDLSEYVQDYAGQCAYSPDGRLPYFLQAQGQGIYSAYPSGMVMFAVPAAAVARVLGADLGQGDVRDRLEKWAACWVACGCLALFFLLALHRVGPGPAWVMTALLATGSVIYSTVGQALWQHGGVILWGLAALLLEFRQVRRRSAAATASQGVACALMMATRLSSGLFVLPFGLWILFRSPRRALLLGGAAAVAYAPWAGVYWLIYGTPLGPSSGQMAAVNFTPNLLGALLGVLCSPARGLLVYQPWLLLAVAALVPAVRRRLPAGERGPCPAGWAMFCAAAIVLHLGLVSSWCCWWGGYCWGSRLASEVVPLLALLMVRPLAALWGTRSGRQLVLGVALLALLLHVPAAFFRSAYWNAVLGDDRQPAALWAWTDPPFLYPLLHRGG